MTSARPASPAQGVEDFLRRHAPALSHQERRGLERTVGNAVSAYLQELRERAQEERERLHRAAVEPLRKPPVRETAATALVWRSETPFTTRDAERDQFRAARRRQGRPATAPPTGRRPELALTVRPVTPTPRPPNPSPRPPPPTSRPPNPSPRPPPQPRPASAAPPKASIVYPRASPVPVARPKSATGVKFRMEQNGATYDEYVPCLKAWIDGASADERAVVYNVMKVLKTGKRDGMEGMERLVPQPYSVYGAGRRPRRPATPLEVYVPPRVPTDSRQYFGGIEDEFRKEQKTRLAATKDYVHERSCFTNATPAFRSSFTIHPEWVSEAKINKTAMTRTSSNGLRYGARKA